METLCACRHYQSDHVYAGFGPCDAKDCVCDEFAEAKGDYRNLGEDMEKVILGLKSRFGRIPTDNEVYRFIWGTKESRERIYANRGLPENQR